MRILLSIMLFLVVVFTSVFSFAFSEITGLFIDEGVSTLARGGMKRLPEDQEKLDFNSPLFLESNGKIRSDVTFEHQRTIREYNGSWAGSHAYSEQLESAVAVPYSLWDGKLIGNVAAGYGYRSYDVRAVSIKEDVSIDASERLYAKNVGFFLKSTDKLSLGISMVDTDYRIRPEIPIEINIAPVEFVSVGFKRSYTDMSWNFTGLISGSNGSFPLVYTEEYNELLVEGKYNKYILAQYSQDIQHVENKRFTGRLELPHILYLTGDYTIRGFKFNQEFSVNDLSGGYLKGECSWREYRIGAGANLSKHWNVEANFRHQSLNSSGGGIANSSAVVNFWPSLIVGNYNHLYNIALDTQQYHLGAEYKGDNATFGIGGQYIDIRPVAGLTYWRSLLFGLGKSGQETLLFDTDRIKLIFVSFGTGYRWDKISVNFACGQFIPIEIHERTKVTATTTPSTGGSSGAGGSSKNLYSQFKDFIGQNPGGNIVRFMVSVNF
jgi:hypothetical protein